MQRSPGERTGGFSLIELMIAMTITLVISGAIYGLMAGRPDRLPPRAGAGRPPAEHPRGHGPDHARHRQRGLGDAARSCRRSRRASTPAAPARMGPDGAGHRRAGDAHQLRGLRKRGRLLEPPTAGRRTTTCTCCTWCATSPRSARARRSSWIMDDGTLDGPQRHRRIRGPGVLRGQRGGRRELQHARRPSRRPMCSSTSARPPTPPGSTWWQPLHTEPRRRRATRRPPATWWRSASRRSSATRSCTIPRAPPAPAWTSANPAAGFQTIARGIEDLQVQYIQAGLDPTVEANWPDNAPTGQSPRDPWHDLDHPGAGDALRRAARPRTSQGATNAAFGPAPCAAARPPPGRRVRA